MNGRNHPSLIASSPCEPKAFPNSRAQDQMRSELNSVERKVKMLEALKTVEACYKIL